MADFLLSLLPIVFKAGHSYFSIIVLLSLWNKHNRGETLNRYWAITTLLVSVIVNSFVWIANFNPVYILTGVGCQILCYRHAINAAKKNPLQP